MSPLLCRNNSWPDSFPIIQSCATPQSRSNIGILLFRRKDKKQEKGEEKRYDYIIEMCLHFKLFFTPLCYLFNPFVFLSCIVFLPLHLTSSGREMFGAFVLKESYKNWKEMRWGHEKLKGDWKLAVKKKKKHFRRVWKKKKKEILPIRFVYVFVWGWRRN